MDFSNRATVAGVFKDRTQAERAVAELRSLGFRPEQIGFAHKTSIKSNRSTICSAQLSSRGLNSDCGGVDGDAESKNGAQPGALWRLCTITDEAEGELGQALIDLGFSEVEADYYNHEFEAGRTVVAVSLVRPDSAAESVLRHFGSYDISLQGRIPEGCDSNQTTVLVRKPGQTTHRTITVPIHVAALVDNRQAGAGYDSPTQSGHQQVRIPVRVAASHAKK